MRAFVVLVSYSSRQTPEGIYTGEYVVFVDFQINKDQ